MMETEIVNNPINDEFNDWKRERNVLMQEMFSSKSTFAEDMKDSLGEEIREALIKKIVAKEVEEKKENKFKNFLDKLSLLCR